MGYMCVVINKQKYEASTAQSGDRSDSLIKLILNEKTVTGGEDSVQCKQAVRYDSSRHNRGIKPNTVHNH